MEKSEKKVFVYIAEMPEKAGVTLQPQSRMDEFSACKNARVQRQKYWVWRLLGWALERSFGVDLTTINARKNERGKWVCDEYAFSLAHSGNVAAVALSLGSVGVDVEKSSKKLLGLGDKILTNREKTVHESLETCEREGFLLKKWTEKESIFKRFGTGVFLPRKIETDGCFTQTKTFEIGGENYWASVACEATCNVEWTVVTGFDKE